jgi:hypothetical protein
LGRSKEPHDCGRDDIGLLEVRQMRRRVHRYENRPRHGRQQRPALREWSDRIVAAPDHEHGPRLRTQPPELLALVRSHGDGGTRTAPRLACSLELLLDPVS